MAKGKTVMDKFALVGIDTIKNVIFDRLQRARGIRFSNSLEPVYCEQLASERRVVRYSRGQPKARFERVSERRRNEALDCLVYATAARSAFAVNWQRQEDLAKAKEPVRKPIWSKLAR
jgi:phage terminase large subunit GpA-like protein